MQTLLQATNIYHLLLFWVIVFIFWEKISPFLANKWILVTNDQDIYPSQQANIPYDCEPETICELPHEEMGHMLDILTEIFLVIFGTALKYFSPIFTQHLDFFQTGVDLK